MDKINNRIAALDMGTNSFHLVIVEQKPNGKLNLLDREREIIRLGSQQGNNLSFISNDEIERAISVIKRFITLAEHYNAKIRAVATSAVREAKNQKEFIDTILKETGVFVEVIDGHKEAELIFKGISDAVDIKNKQVLCVDIGGGSTEFIYSVNEKIIFAESVKIGAVRLSKLFFPDNLITDIAINECSRYVENQILENKNIKINVELDFAVGSSGTVDTIFNLMQAKKKNKLKGKMNGFQFTRESFETQYKKVIQCRTVKERINIPGMEEKRADIIPAGLIILRKIFELFKIERMTISEYALREGIVLDTLKNL